MQVQALQMPSRAETIDFVSSSLDDLESGRTRPLLNHMAKAWIDGDLAELARYESWCDCLAPRRTGGDEAPARRPQPAAGGGDRRPAPSGPRVFAAVGSLHMIGPRGLPALLASAASGSSRCDLPAEPAARGARPARPG